jgi:hypothetical protein
MKSKKFTLSQCLSTQSMQMQEIKLTCAKEIKNYQVPSQPGDNLTSVNGVAWNQCAQFDKQFVTVDEKSRLMLYDGDRLKAHETIGSGQLATVSVEPRTG